VKRILLFGLLAGMMTFGTGCGLFQSVFCYQPCGGRCGCDPCSCGDGCDDGCGPVCGPTRRACREPVCAPRRRAVVADCGDDCDCGYPCGRACGRPCAKPCGRATCSTCDPCGDPCGGDCCGRVWHRGPLSCLFALFTPNCWCGPSCGRRYWGDFYSDPPDCWDPCDGYGNYSGTCHGCGGHPGYSRGPVGGQYEGQYGDGMIVPRGNDRMPQGERIITPSPSPNPNGAPHKAIRPVPQQQ
jgi:hypothetical protein